MKLKYIDSLRGLAIIGVIIVHSSQWGASIYTKGEDFYPWFVNNFFEQGARGVQLFYVVSAFTLFLSYQFRKRQNNFNLKGFFIRRIFRVVPLYYIGILFFGILSPICEAKQLNLDPLSLISNIFLLNSLYPSQTIVPGGWTISVEILFYCLLPFLYRIIKTTDHAIRFTLITTLITICYNYLFFHLFPYNKHNLYFLFSSLPNQLPLFGFGIIAFFMVYKKDLKVSKLHLLLLAIVGLLQLTLDRFIPNHVIFGLPFLILLLVGSKTKLLNYAPLVFIGKISFTAYFAHFAVLHWLNYYNFVDFFNTDTFPLALLNFTLRLMVVMFFVVIISTPVYLYFEVPMMAIGKKIIKKLKYE